MKKFFRLTFIIVLGFLAIKACTAKERPDTFSVSIFPKVYERAFPNPLKGFRSSSVKVEDYPTLTRLYVKWNEIENSESDGVEKILDYCNQQWVDLPGRNVKVIPRVYLEWPCGWQNSARTRDTVTADWGDTRYCDRFWPADLQRGDYSSEQFKKRLLNLIAKMGKAWDNDSRVAYIEMGLIGWWGEQHTPFINTEMQKLMGEAFTSAFRNKLVLVRQAKDFQAFSFGSYWDSFAHSSQIDEAEMLIAQNGKWEISVRGGEVAYDWGDMSNTGTNPNESLKNKANREYIIDFIRKVHCNHLGWINNYNNNDAEIQSGADEMQKALGYRFVVDDFSYSSNLISGDSFKVNFTVRNVGSSPFYYNWPVELSILNPETKQPFWKATFQNNDIRTWLPGDDWDTIHRKYRIEPKKNQIAGSFNLPENLPKGEYILALAILDPAGNLPCVRFAIQNYFKGGRHPMGKIGIDQTVTNFEMNETVFDDLYNDRTLHYKFENGK